MLIAEKERKLKEHQQKVVKEGEKKGLTINCMKAECMAVNNSNSELAILKSRKYENLNIFQAKKELCTEI